ncbi:hypothetical protein TW80_12250 [Loktanella sp. S4079]|nr:hypothetical protein TW80_12250 [Loktanella sp. S4079]
MKLTITTTIIAVSAAVVAAILAAIIRKLVARSGFADMRKKEADRDKQANANIYREFKMCVHLFTDKLGGRSSSFTVEQSGWCSHEERPRLQLINEMV